MLVAIYLFDSLATSYAKTFSYNRFIYWASSLITTIYSWVCRVHQPAGYRPNRYAQWTITFFEYIKLVVLLK